MTFQIPEPELQIDFAARLAEFRTSMLQDALVTTVGTLDIPTVDAELAQCVPASSLSALASHGLRGELVFPVPCVLRVNPCLLGYYRLLYGYSQKEFYGGATGAGKLNGLETRGTISKACDPLLEEFCKAMGVAGAMLLAGIAASKVNAGLLDDLTLLTLGPQLRGGANVRRGTAGIRLVFNAIHEIVASAATASDDNHIELINAAGRKVVIAFAPDPDIVIVEEMASGANRHLIAIEVKAGADFSNIHNRIGEAEKSHQKARSAGYTECWTVVNVDRIDIDIAHRESPSTNRFYKISDLAAKQGEYADFRDRVVSLTGIA